MDISGRGISIGADRRVEFDGNAQDAANLLAEIGVSLRSSRGHGVQSGFLRLSVRPGADHGRSLHSISIMGGAISCTARNSKGV